YPTHLIPTTVVGSYPQPDWLVDRSALDHHGVPRVAAPDIWRVAEPWLAQALDGIDAEHPGQVGRSGGGTTPVPRVVGTIRRRGPVELRDAEFLLRHA